MLFHKVIKTFNVSLTSTFHARDTLERLSRKAPLYIEPPSGKNKCFRVETMLHGKFTNIGNIPADISKILLNDYSDYKYKIKSHKVTFADNGKVGCDVVLQIYK